MHNTHPFYILHVQVLSETVATSLEQFVGEQAQETARFVLMLDRFFDGLNVWSLSEFFKHLKPY